MISKISAYSPNFSGSVRIGKNNEERRQIASDILNIPEDNREYFIESINATKAILAARTPNDVNLTLHVENYNHEDGLYQGIAIEATDSDTDDAVIVGKTYMDYIFHGEENGYFGVDIGDKFAEFRENVLNNVTDTYVAKQHKGAPTSTEEVLDRLA